ncbi:hypothetical protein NEUTE1DRAFT_107210 [Neurospora tetrasperma FGSC 2508]|uniref:Uncharacterized protein n=1 Tax=Neurospora tetrasperma (strain FGSC 2508 / ATCC MYA-4615 / P0657) TaxID=510951 RepID=F8MD99_NEUT8|nr:uncharacterized protein NEUTE1DRAFT_107210 [Neurospora tetrasperma FGSC 2508]EGO60591.1 hypothetical protein NEUTE1DRAFT_107210 [Neurospora tetrasperma FGSC 2508]
MLQVTDLKLSLGSRHSLPSYPNVTISTFSRPCSCISCYAHHVDISQMTSYCVITVEHRIAKEFLLMAITANKILLISTDLLPQSAQKESGSCGSNGSGGPRSPKLFTKLPTTGTEGLKSQGRYLHLAMTIEWITPDDDNVPLLPTPRAPRYYTLPGRGISASGTPSRNPQSPKAATNACPGYAGGRVTPRSRPPGICDISNGIEAGSFWPVIFQGASLVTHMVP